MKCPLFLITCISTAIISWTNKFFKLILCIPTERYIHFTCQKFLLTMCVYLCLGSNNAKSRKTHRKTQTRIKCSCMCCNSIKYSKRLFMRFHIFVWFVEWCWGWFAFLSLFCNGRTFRFPFYGPQTCFYLPLIAAQTFHLIQWWNIFKDNWTQTHTGE